VSSSIRICAIAACARRRRGTISCRSASRRARCFSITRGEPAWFHSSDPVRRGFCRDCGTPLFFDTLESDGIAVTLGSLDDPAAFPPVSQ
jgi:hypothetical protein